MRLWVTVKFCAFFQQIIRQKSSIHIIIETALKVEKCELWMRTYRRTQKLFRPNELDTR